MLRTYALLLFVCLASSQPAWIRPLAAEEAPEPGTARYPVVGPIETLDPPRASSDAARLAVVNIYDQLYAYDYVERPFVLRPALAASLPEVSEDRRQLTIRLRKDVSYALDACFGAQKTRLVTSQDVVFCIKRLMDAQTKSPGQWMLTGRIRGLDAFVEASATVKPDPHRHDYRTADGYPEVSGLEIIDDSTLRIHLLKPMPELPWFLAGPWFSIYPPEAVRAYGSSLGSRAVGAGPYRVVMFLEGRKLLLRANPHYRKETYPASSSDEDSGCSGQALPRSPVVELISYASELQAWQAFLNGDVDLAEVPRDAFHAAVDVHTGTLLPHLQKRGVRLIRAPRPEIHYDAFNMLDKVVGTPNGAKGLAIRRAICLAADDTYALTRLYTNRSERVFGPILPEFQGFDPKFINDWLPQPGESREEALRLAREALAGAGLAEGKGVPPLKMHILEDDTSRRLFDILQKQIEEIGIHLESVVVTWSELQEVLRRREAQIFTSSWYADYPDAQNFLQLFYSGLAPEPNYANFSNKAFDALYEEAARLPTGEDPSEIYEEMQEVVARECPWRFRLRRIRWSAHHTWLSGYRHNEFAPKYFGYCQVLDGDRDKALQSWR
jgi:oligopeptide transport system substrate-binding protein